MILIDAVQCRLQIADYPFAVAAADLAVDAMSTMLRAGRLNAGGLNRASRRDKCDDDGCDEKQGSPCDCV